ncbi:MAG: DUF2283 domain-containing protein [Sinobacteraceae bacterium]|nr:DUF2283 domain-containing protein [Nevskiaceae bacterium]
MKVSYDKTTDTLQVVFSDRPVHESDEVNQALSSILMPRVPS